MYTIKLNGANAQKVADLIGATIICEFNDSITVSGGDPSIFDQTPSPTFIDKSGRAITRPFVF